MNEELQRLIDRSEISDTLIRFAFAQDERDWPAFDTIFADEVVMDMSEHLGTPAETMTKAEMLDLLKATLTGFEATHHLIPNHLITVDGDRARCRAYANAYHMVPTEPGVADYCVVRALYDLGFVRVADGWRINAMAVKRTAPVEGYAGVYQVAAARVNGS
jgi:3-phenylpropionate/cinnamic acid dioxygenase small subunit